MKKCIYMAVAAIAALSSCTNDDAILNEGGQNENGVTTFTATIEGDNATRATYDATNRKALWEATTDKINVGGAVYTAETTGAITNFTGTGAAKGTDQKYHAYFPASLCSGTTASLPATMTLEDGKFNMPMYAESETEEFTFKNICGVLAITVPNTQMSSVKSIEVSSDQQMNGEIDNVTAEGVLTFASATPLTDANKKITLTAAEAISIPDGGSKTFYVPVPAGTHNPLLITISDGTNINAMITKKSGGVEVARNTMYSITFAGAHFAAWENQMTLGKSEATSIVIETGVATLPTAGDATHQKLNTAGTLWAVLDGTTLKIQTSASKIKGHDSFINGNDGLFENYTQVTCFTGLDKIDFSEVNNMRYMFFNCNKLTSLDLSSFNTSNVTSMVSMFYACNALASLDLSSFDTSNVTSMAGMFGNCFALTSLDLSSFDTSNVTSMANMFDACKALTSLNLSNFNTSNVTNMSYMFYECNKLSALTLSNNFVMTQDTNKFAMFYLCGKDATGGKCTVSGATGDKDTAGTVKYALSHSTEWDNTYMQFATE